MLSQYVEPSYALSLFDGGSSGLAYLLKERLGDIDQLETPLRGSQKTARCSTRS